MQASWPGAWGPGPGGWGPVWARGPGLGLGARGCKTRVHGVPSSYRGRTVRGGCSILDYLDRIQKCGLGFSSRPGRLAQAGRGPLAGAPVGPSGRGARGFWGFWGPGLGCLGRGRGFRGRGPPWWPLGPRVFGEFLTRLDSVLQTSVLGPRVLRVCQNAMRFLEGEGRNRFMQDLKQRRAKAATNQKLRALKRLSHRMSSYLPLPLLLGIPLPDLPANILYVSKPRQPVSL